MVYVAGWNTPGYLPEVGPYEYEVFEGARDLIVDTLGEQADNMENTHADGIRFHEAALAARGWKQGYHTSAVMPDGYVYWIMPREDGPLDPPATVRARVEVYDEGGAMVQEYEAEGESIATIAAAAANQHGRMVRVRESRSFGKAEIAQRRLEVHDG